ncbi:MAG: hypothetical protein VX766_16555 [Pseudomonadota bacterium]|nr:hypothetical protein [Pseudomonadota bacterium]
MQMFWYLVEDFVEQPLIMKAFIGWGWLCVVLMFSAMFASAF